MRKQILAVHTLFVMAMSKRMKILMLIISLSFSIFISGCLFLNSGYKSDIDAKEIGRQIDKINVTIVNTTEELPNGISYVLKLTNSSPYLIKQNSVYLSYPILRDNGSNSNPYKVEATGNKLDIKPDEEVVLNVQATATKAPATKTSDICKHL